MPVREEFHMRSTAEERPTNVDVQDAYNDNRESDSPVQSRSDVIDESDCDCHEGEPLPQYFQVSRLNIEKLYYEYLRTSLLEFCTERFRTFAFGLSSYSFKRASSVPAIITTGQEMNASDRDDLNSLIRETGFSQMFCVQCYNGKTSASADQIHILHRLQGAPLAS
jgi:hypothetical protein